jgi:hypothetical protein
LEQVWVLIKGEWLIEVLNEIMPSTSSLIIGTPSMSDPAPVYLRLDAQLGGLVQHVAPQQQRLLPADGERQRCRPAVGGGHWESRSACRLIDA